MQLAAGDFAGALTSRRKAFAIREKVSEQDPKNVQARFDLGVAHGDLAEALSANGELTPSLEHAQHALSILQQLSAADPTNAVYQRNVALCYEKFGQIYSSLGSDQSRPNAQRAKDWNEARNSYRKGFELFSKLRDRGTLMPADANQPEAFSANIRKCEGAVERLNQR